MNPLDLSGVDPVRWTEIRMRIAVVERFLAIDTPSEEDRMAHAAELGLRRTQFMNLVRAWKAHGTAPAMAGAKAHRQKLRIGWRSLPEEAERVMHETLERLGPDVRPVEAYAAVSDALISKGLTVPTRPTVWRRLMKIRQTRGVVGGAGDFVVAECRIRMPVVSEQGVAMPSLLIAASTSNGCILAAMVLTGQSMEHARFGDAMKNAAPDGIVTIDAAYSTWLRAPAACIVPVTPGIARSTLSRAIGQVVGNLKLQFNRTAFAAERLLKTKEDRPLGCHDARTIIEDAIMRHNSSRGGSAFASLI